MRDMASIHGIYSTHDVPASPDNPSVGPEDPTLTGRILGSVETFADLCKNIGLLRWAGHIDRSIKVLTESWLYELPGVSGASTFLKMYDNGTSADDVVCILIRQIFPVVEDETEAYDEFLPFELEIDGEVDYSGLMA